MMLAEWLFPDESKAVVPAPSSKAQSAIGLVAICPSAVHPKPSRQTDAAPVRTRLAAPNVRVPIRGIALLYPLRACFVNAGKLEITWRLRQETTMTLKWIAERLHAGRWTSLSNALI